MAAGKKSDVDDMNKIERFGSVLNNDVFKELYRRTRAFEYLNKIGVQTYFNLARDFSKSGGLIEGSHKNTNVA